MLRSAERECEGFIGDCTSPCAKLCDAYSYNNAQWSQEFDSVYRNAVFFRPSLWRLSNMNLTVPFHSEHCAHSLERQSIVGKYPQHHDEGIRETLSISHDEPCNINAAVIVNNTIVYAFYCLCSFCAVKNLCMRILCFC